MSSAHESRKENTIAKTEMRVIYPPKDDLCLQEKKLRSFSCPEDDVYNERKVMRVVRLAVASGMPL